MSLLLAKMKTNQLKMKALKCSQQFSHCKSMGFFQTLSGSQIRSSRSDLAEFRLIQDFMVVLVTCKNEEDPIKNEGARVLKTLYIDSSDAKGQVTL